MHNQSKSQISWVKLTGDQVVLRASGDVLITSHGAVSWGVHLYLYVDVNALTA